MNDQTLVICTKKLKEKQTENSLGWLQTNLRIYRFLKEDKEIWVVVIKSAMSLNLYYKLSSKNFSLTHNLIGIKLLTRYFDYIII